MMGTLHHTDDGRVALVFERRLSHPPGKVWRALTETEHLREWFPVVVGTDLAPNATVTFELTAEAKARSGLNGRDAVSEGVVTVFEPPRVLEYTWGAEVVRWELEPDSDGCRLVFTDVFDADLSQPDHRDGAAGAAAGWHVSIDLFDAYLADRNVEWSAWDRTGELTADYLPIVAPPHLAGPSTGSEHDHGRSVG